MNPSTAPRLALRPPRRFLGTLATIVALAALVRAWVIDRDALWLDEGYSWWDAHQPLGALWTLVPTCDPHPPLYFALLHGWIASFGDATVTMRLLSTLLGLATIVVVWCCGRQLDLARGRGDDRFGVGFLAALLFALTPFQVYFSVEARPYALLCFAAALLTWGCLLALRAGLSNERRTASWPRRIGPGSWVALLVGGVVVVWTNNTALLVLGAASAAFILLWILDRGSRATIVPLVVAGIVIALLWAPDWPLLLAQSREITQDFWIAKPSLDGLAYELHNLVGLDVLRATWWIVLAILGGLLLIGRSIGWRWGLMVGALAILPIAFNVIISYAMSPILLSRALIGAAPALVLGLAASAILLRPRALRIAAGCALLLVHAVSLQRYVAADHVKEPWKPVVARLAVEARHAPVLVVPNELVLPLMHEARRQRVVFDVSGVPADYPAPGMTARYPSGKCAPSVIDQDLAPLIARFHDEKTIVLLTRSNNTYDPHEDVAAALRRAGYALAKESVSQPGDLRIMRFVRTTASPVIQD